jgi:DNA-binding PadR family transcriptional regulator
MARRTTLETLLILRDLMRHLPDGEAWGRKMAEDTGVDAGSIYPILQRLESDGWVERRKEVGDPKQLGRPLRFYYSLTVTGATHASEALAKAKARYPAIFGIDPSLGPVTYIRPEQQPMGG